MWGMGAFIFISSSLSLIYATDILATFHPLCFRTQDKSSQKTWGISPFSRMADGASIGHI